MVSWTNIIETIQWKIKLIINSELIFPLLENIFKYCKIKLSYSNTSKENEKKNVLTSWL